MLTPKIGTRESLICGPSLVKKNPVQRRRISSEDSAEMLAVGSLLPFGKRTVSADFAGSHGDVARAEGTNGWISIRTWALKLGIKYCARSPPGVMPRQGINMNPGCM
jgi:hypothetical protein